MEINYSLQIKKKHVSQPHHIVSLAAIYYITVTVQCNEDQVCKMKSLTIFN